MKPNQRGVLINGHQSGSCLSAAGSSSILKLKAVPQIVGSKGKRAVRLSTSISALLILVSIGTLTGVNSAWATIRIQDDPGGRIDKYLQKFAKLRNSHEHIIVDGTCNSACTLLLGTIPRSRICMTKRASLGFHAAWVFDDDGNPVQSQSWTSVLWRNYPPMIRDWIMRNGGLTRRMIFLRGNELNAMYPLCTSPITGTNLAGAKGTKGLPEGGNASLAR